MPFWSWFRRQPATTATWEQVDTELRRLRGQNLLRAREERLMPEDRLRLYEEPQGSYLRQAYWDLTITSDPQQLWAQRQPGEQQLRVADLGWKTFWETLAAALRGRESYLWTQKDQATYR